MPVSAAKAYVHGLTPDAVNREKNDFYPTPPEGTRALLNVESFDGEIWEPACGDGRMSRVLEAAGYRVMSSDLIDRGYGETGVDFLATRRTVPNIVTNPPFKLALPFVRHALECTTGKVAMLVRLAWLEGHRRMELFQTTPLARVWVFSKRLSMPRAGGPTPAGGMIAFAWLVWEQGHDGPPTIGWIVPDKGDE
jgi:hypothetical protein